MTNAADWNIRPLHDPGKRREPVPFSWWLWSIASGLALAWMLWPLNLILGLLLLKLGLLVAVFAGIVWLVCWPFRRKRG